MAKLRLKVHRNYRIDPVLDAELRKRSEDFGIPQTTLIEQALKLYFASGMAKAVSKKLHRAGRFHANPKEPLAPLENNALTAA